MAFDKKNLLLGERYRLKRKIGEGGMATVYLALDEKLGRKVAVKVLHPHMEKNKDLRRRFYHEAQAISSLEHSNILKIYDFSGQSSKKMWIVTEIIKGHNLSEFVENFTNGKLNYYVSGNIVREVCKALQLAHQKNIVHRDVKPENVMVTSKGEIKLMDFGIAKGVDSNSATQTGTFMGSPSYMSPEQVRGRDVDTRSDIYSLGILFYEIATGRLPFIGNSTHDLIIKIAAGKFIAPNLINTNMPIEINKLIMEMMSKDKLDRPDSIESISKHLDHILTAKGFVESHVELERYFKDRISYESKLRQMEKNIVSNQQRNILLKKSNMISTITKKPQIKKPVNYAQEKKQKNPIRKTAVAQKPQYIPQNPKTIPIPVIAQNQIKRKTNPPRAKKTVVFIQKNNTVNKHPALKGQPRSPRRVVVKQTRTYSQLVMNMLIICVIALGTIFGYKEWKKRNGTPRFSKNTKSAQITKTKKTTKRAKRKKHESKENKENKKAVERKTKRYQQVKNNKKPKIKKNFHTTRINIAIPKTTKKNIRININKKPNEKNTQKPTKKQQKKTEENKKPVVIPSNMEKETIEVAESTSSKNIDHYLTLKSKPAAKIHINGEYKGTTIDSIYSSKKIKINDFPVSIELRREQYRTISQTITSNDFNSKRNLAIGPLILKKSGSSQNRNYTLKISSNQKNFEIKILNLKTKELLNEIQSRNKVEYELERGKYEVVVVWKQQVITRRISLTGKSKSVSFHGEFQ